MRAYYANSIGEYLASDEDSVLGALTAASTFAVDIAQRNAWLEEIRLLRETLPAFPSGELLLEFVVPRLGKRIDAVLLLNGAVVVIEFKTNATAFARADVEQTWDYALDLKNFHETSHHRTIYPVLVITGASGELRRGEHRSTDGVADPSLVCADRFAELLQQLVGQRVEESAPLGHWESGRYRPTPTIIEAATSLYRRHSVQEIARHGADAKNLTCTSEKVAAIIRQSRDSSSKSICFVTGVPGAGKTLVGLDVATRFQDASSELHSVYLSGNGPLVAILTEALARDRIQQERLQGRAVKKGEARQAVKAFIQNVHHFRDEGLKDPTPPPEHVTIFDEAQRAWNLAKTVDFMQRKKGHRGFQQSEPDFLISCLDRHPDWAVVVCLVGGGQEINTGEAGIGEWLEVIRTRYPDWQVHLSSELTESEYAAADAIAVLAAQRVVHFDDDLHLPVSMRSFRAEQVSPFVRHVLDLEVDVASDLYRSIARQFPLVMTRSVEQARRWLRRQARGSERYGLVVSSQALRLKPHAIDVRAPVDPVHWFLDDRDDVRSSFYLEDVATESQVQGLELDWVGVVWDADLRRHGTGWQHHSFVGSRWQRILKPDRQAYLKNAYRVLLTRARQGMVIVVPRGEPDDPTRDPAFYDGTYRYLRSIGIPELG
ncbi:DUF2075 domain-containing protein [Rubrivivax albus]|uniref:DUF2075 domain-containing protein n=1 Tax=Rubrivivax albus TaxID=2499835 RepID=A0A437JYH9_9BURK|nr:DUF2075 domain-containing protein [Rubrivivax albus]RVT52732.1 DUF2075 domain-containing protein [Rubrivivax albus]